MKNNKVHFRLTLRRILPLLLFISLIFGTSLPSLASENARAIWGDFKNPLKLPPGTNPDTQHSSSAAFFSGGHVNTTPDHGDDGSMKQPRGGGFRLASSSLGHTVARTIPHPDFQKAATERSLKMLYYEHADPEGDLGKDIAALRYKALLYAPDGEDRIAAQFQKMAELWTEADRSRALDAGKIVLDALKYDPYDRTLRNALLDIYYDIAVADLTRAMEMMVEANKARLGAAFAYVAAPGEFQISEEISLMKQALEGYDASIRPYFDLLKDPMGIDMMEIDENATAQGKPFGYYLFETEVPVRSLYAPLYKDGEELLSVVADGHDTADADDSYERPRIFNGYKDLILLFNMERDTARAAAKLAKLYALRSDAGDADEARKVIGEFQLKTYTDGSILNGIFPQDQAEEEDSQSGLTEAKAGWSQGLTEMSGVRSFLEGDANPLGLDKDFLVLCYTMLPSGEQQFSDTYQFFADTLFRGGSPSGQLAHALQKYGEAEKAYQSLQMNKDQIRSQLEGIRNQYGMRLQKIVGRDPSQAGYNELEPTEGSEISIQWKNIELARLRIERNQQEFENLHEQINNEIERRGKEAGINDLISQTYIKYGDKQASLTKRIGEINAAQAAANAAAQSASSFGSAIASAVTNPVAAAGLLAGGYAALANGGFQACSEIAKARLQAEKEKLAAEEKSKITYLSDKISAANSEARVKDLLLGMSILAIDSEEAAIILAQEMAKLESLYEEKAYLETRWQESKSELADRYYADPSHRIISDNTIIGAGFAFDEAQYWIFMMARALDYRLNRRFEAAGEDGSVYTSQTVFKLRNAKELENMARAMDNHFQKEGLGKRVSRNFAKYSLREDVLGFRRGSDSQGNPFEYPDPVTGEMVSPIDAFQSYLKHVAYNGSPAHLTGFDEVVRIEFSTGGTNLEEDFFPDGQWNEKIKWISVKINAAGLEYSGSDIRTYLGQSGIAFVRNESCGIQTDPERPDMREGEMTSYPIRHWYYENGKWMSKPSFGFSNIYALITKDPDKPGEAWQYAQFHELSPAVTKWTLEIPTKKLGRNFVETDKVTDIEIWFFNYNIDRNQDCK